MPCSPSKPRICKKCISQQQSLNSFIEEAVRDKLTAENCEPGMTTVGCALSLSHDAPTPLGMDFTVTVTLVKQEKRVFEFALEARDERGIISKGTHTRVAVMAEKFQQKADAIIKNM